MIPWFLSLFRDFKALKDTCADLRAALEEVSAEKLLLQDRLDSALQDKQNLWNTMQTALNSERAALRMQVNHAVQRSGGGIPYPDSHSLQHAPRTPEDLSPIGRRGRMLPSEAVRSQAQRFTEEFVESLNKFNKVER